MFSTKMNNIPSHADIAFRAFQIWKSRQAPQSWQMAAQVNQIPEDDWYEAERELTAELLAMTELT